MAASAASTANGAATPDAALASALRCLLRIADADQARRAHRHHPPVLLVEDGEFRFDQKHLWPARRAPPAPHPALPAQRFDWIDGLQPADTVDPQQTELAPRVRRLVDDHPHARHPLGAPYPPPTS